MPVHTNTLSACAALVVMNAHLGGYLQAAMLSQPGDLSSGLLTQLGNFFQKPPTPAAPGLAPNQPLEGNTQPGGPFAGGRNSLGGAGGMNGAALTGAASGLQAAAQSLLRQRMEALRQQGVGLRGAFTPAQPGLGQWEVMWLCSAVLQMQFIT